MTEGARRVQLYAAVGRELTQYGVDVEGAALTRRGLLEPGFGRSLDTSLGLTPRELGEPG